MTRVCRGFEVPPCALSKPDPNRRIGLCTLTYGTDSTNAVPAATSHSPNAAATATAAVAVVSPISYPSLPVVESREDDVANALSVPAAVCPGYPTVVDEEALLDFPPADLPPDADGFRIVVTHVDDDCHIYGHALRSGTQCATLTGYSSLFMELAARFVALWTNPYYTSVGFLFDELCCNA